MKLQPDLLAAKRWMYPLNHPKRDYQFNIVKHSLFENTLVALPTGLGKTFIAGVVMLNCASSPPLLNPVLICAICAMSDMCTVQSTTGFQREKWFSSHHPNRWLRNK